MRVCLSDGRCLIYISVMRTLYRRCIATPIRYTYIYLPIGEKTIMKYLLFTLLAFSITSIANASDEEISCRKELGKKQAAVLVRQCIEISPATHPPCNDQNACSLIKDEIKRGCEFAKTTAGVEIPKFCD